MAIAFHIWLTILGFIFIAFITLRLTATTKSYVKFMQQKGFHYKLGLIMTILIFIMIPYTFILFITWVWF